MIQCASHRTVLGKVGGRAALLIMSLGENTTCHTGSRGSTGSGVVTRREGTLCKGLCCGSCGKKQTGQGKRPHVCLSGPLWRALGTGAAAGCLGLGPGRHMAMHGVPECEPERGHAGVLT